MSGIPIIEVLRDIAVHGRPQCKSDQIGSAWARQACRQGLAVRVGVTWSHLDGTRLVAAYALTREGVEMMSDDEYEGVVDDDAKKIPNHPHPTETRP